MAKVINQPPISEVTADKIDVFQNETVKIDGTKSRDPAKHGRVQRWQFSGDGITFSKPTGVYPEVIQTDATFSKDGKLKITLDVWDKADNKNVNTDTNTVSINVKAVVTNKPIDFGLKVVGLDPTDQLIVAKKMGVTQLRTSVEMQNFNGKANFIDQIFAGGLMCNVNVNEKPAGTARKFCTDLVTYESRLRWFYDVYAPKGGVRKISMAFCENEATVDNFYDDKIENYIPVLKVFTEVSNEYGVPCADSAVFIEFINAFLNGGIKNNQNYIDNMWLIEQMVDIPLTHCNVHYALKGTYTPGVILRSMQWLRTKLNRPVGTNEFHIDGASVVQVSAAMNEFISAQPAFIQPWGGGNGSDGDALNEGTELTARGIAIRDVIVAYDATL